MLLFKIDDDKKRKLKKVTNGEYKFHTILLNNNQQNILSFHFCTYKLISTRG